QPVTCHTLFTNLFINDIDQGDGTCVRMPMDAHNATDPVNDLDSRDMACGHNGAQGVPLICPVPANSKLSFQFRSTPDASLPGVIDTSHLGPCAVYMKNVGSAIKESGVGDGWFKTGYWGYNSTTKKWCTETLIEEKGKLSVDIPANLAGGYYLVRPEILALQDPDKEPPNPQFYVGCAQIFLNSNGTTLPKYTVKIPGCVGVGDPGVRFDVYKPVGPMLRLGRRFIEWELVRGGR
ncbi:glycoside hydrolase, partial [Rhexocercosporidium sp. MPI-PUGE-AT-0058]